MIFFHFFGLILKTCNPNNFLNFPPIFFLSEFIFNLFAYLNFFDFFLWFFHFFNCFSIYFFFPEFFLRQAITKIKLEMRQNATKILKIHLSHQSKNKICVWQLCWINCESRNKSKRKFCFQQQKKICFSCLWIDAWNLVWYAEQPTRKRKSGFLSFPHFLLTLQVFDQFAGLADLNFLFWSSTFPWGKWMHENFC